MTSTQTYNGLGTVKIMGFAYDVAGNRTGVTWPDGQSLTYVFDTLNRMSSITDNHAAQTLASFGYDTASERVSQSYRNGTSAAYVYNASGWLTNLTHSYVGSTAASITYGYDQSGHDTAETNGNSAYEWAPVGGPDSAPSLSWAYSFDNLGRMTQAVSGSTTVTLWQDPDGVRMSKASTSSTTAYVTVGGQSWVEYDGSNNLQRRYVYGPGNQVVAMADASWTWTYLHQDKRGSTIATSNAAGAVPAGQVYTYDPYGQTLTSSGVPFRYTGHRLDSETGLYYTAARYYDPVTGEWISADPIGTKDGINPYLYVHSDPVNGTDPSGTKDCNAGESKQTGSRVCQADGSAPGSGAGNNHGMRANPDYSSGGLEVLADAA